MWGAYVESCIGIVEVYQVEVDGMGRVRKI